MQPALTLVSAPAVEPVTLAQAKLHLELDSDITKYDDLIEDELIPAAREYFEKYTGRAFVDQTWRVALDDFSEGEIWLPKPPLLAVTGIAYTDTGGAAQVLAADQYTVDNSFSAGPRIVPAWQVAWPAVRSVPAAVLVTFRAGYADRAGSPQQDGSVVPGPLRAAMKLYIGSLFKDREAGQVPQAALDLARPYRVEGLGA